MFNSLKRKNSEVSDKNKTENDLKENLDNNLPKIDLALNDIDKNVMSNVQKEYLKDELDELKSIHKNDVDVSPVYFNYNQGVLEVKVFIRNAFVRTVNFDKVPFIVSDKDGNTIARKVFDLKDVGDIEPNTAKPYKFFFEDEYILKKDFDCENLKITFDGTIKCFQGVETKIENLPEGINPAEYNKYDALLQKLSKLEPNTINMSAVELINADNGDIGITIIIRNGYKKDIDLNNIPITLYDKGNVTVASGVFKSTTFNVKALSASLYRLIFKADEITSNDYDISTWNVNFKCKN